jgi:hypothetical protein
LREARMSKAKPVHGTPRLNTPDLIFKMIEDHKKVAAEYEAICRDVVPGTCVPDPEKEFEISAIEAEARHELACTSATSLTGLLAVLKYVGKFTDAGVPNSAFDQDESDERHYFCPGHSARPVSLLKMRS